MNRQFLKCVKNMGAARAESRAPCVNWGPGGCCLQRMNKEEGRRVPGRGDGTCTGPEVERAWSHFIPKPRSFLLLSVSSWILRPRLWESTVGGGQAGGSFAWLGMESGSA